MLLSGARHFYLSTLLEVKVREYNLRMGSNIDSPVTHRIYALALELLETHPEGLRWVDLLKKIKESDRSFHPKTVNGCVWKLVEKFPDKVYKPSKGLFSLVKYKTSH